ncbi:MAG: hypothetical protein HZC12_09885 [Nitrospirae bacterium]|nr:hypothetical protein [Nitrospirota bacterium]
MQILRLFMLVMALFLVVSIGAVSAVEASDQTVKLSGTRFEMEVPAGWAPGYKDLDEKLLMIFFKDAKSGATIEGVYLRKVQASSFTLADFKKWRIDAENKRYEGKGHKVVKEGALTIAGEKGNYIMTTWKDGGKEFEKHTAQYLKDGKQYMVVLHGEKGKVDKKVFDHAVKTFALGKE